MKGEWQRPETARSDGRGRARFEGLGDIRIKPQGYLQLAERPKLRFRSMEHFRSLIIDICQSKMEGLGMGQIDSEQSLISRVDSILVAKDEVYSFEFDSSNHTSKCASIAQEIG